MANTNHALIESKPWELGVGCKCGQRFPTKKATEGHVADLNLIEANEAKAKAQQQESEKEVAHAPQTPAEATEEPAPVPAPTKESDAAEPAVVAPEAAKTGEIVTSPASPPSITNMEMANQMVLKYATSLINSEAAAEFQTRMKLIQRLNPKLASVTPQSLFMAMMACVHLRLMPNTTEQLAFIIPYGNEAQFQIEYKGLAELAYRTGNVVKIDQ